MACSGAPEFRRPWLINAAGRHDHPPALVVRCSGWASSTASFAGHRRWRAKAVRSTAARRRCPRSMRAAGSGAPALHHAIEGG